MTLEPVVIDSCVFSSDTDFIHWLKGYHGKKVISSVTYAELQVYFISKKNKEPAFFDNIMRRSRIEVRWFRKDEALNTAYFGSNSDSFAEDFRDFMIGSHASIAPWVVITNNVKDFYFLEDRVKLPNEFKMEHDGKR